MFDVSLLSQLREGNREAFNSLFRHYYPRVMAYVAAMVEQEVAEDVVQDVFLHVWENRKKLDSKVYLPLIALVIIGSIPGVFMLKNVNTSIIKLIFGVVVIVLGLEMLLREYSKDSGKSSRILLAIIGVASGVLCGLFGVGALLAAYVSRVTDDSQSFKANISAVFIVDNTFRIILYSTLHILTLDTLKRGLILIPFVLIGLIAGMKCSSIMNKNLAKKITALLLVISGISLVIKNI